ncbi:MAG TPA: ligase-associated DNA damage response exonuclease [Burkholderiales bacterium]
MDLVVARPQGLYCPPGDFYVDPWRPVDRAIVTHAHGDHARAGSRHYLAAASSARVLVQRLGAIDLQSLEYGEIVVVNGVNISLHPAGHVLGSAQVRIEYGGEVWVISGDYKLEPDPTCTGFDPVRCHTFITESTFGLPIYRWEQPAAVFADINAWWRSNADNGRASVMFGYAFGKAQRLLAGVETGIGPIVCHGAVERLNDAYRATGVSLPPTLRVADMAGRAAYGRTLILAPPSAQSTPWLRRFGEYSDAFASGWMRLRGARRRKNVDRGFVLSDHADWPGLLGAISATGARRVIVTHGYVPVLVRWLQQQGLEAGAFETEYGDEEAGTDADASDSKPLETDGMSPGEGAIR